MSNRRMGPRPMDFHHRESSDETLNSAATPSGRGETSLDMDGSHVYYGQRAIFSGSPREMPIALD